MTKTGGRPASKGVIPGDYALSVGKPASTPPPGWRWTLLSDVARLETGHTPSRKHPEYWGGPIPWIGIRDATGNHGTKIFETQQYTNALGIENSSARVLPPNTVCLSRTASVGYVVVMGRHMATSQDFVNWVCSPQLDYRFLKYVLLSEREALLRYASGTTHQTIYFPEAKAFHVCMPAIAEQHRIVDVLQPLDDRIALLHDTNATLEAIAQALFKSWFIDFDPVRAKSQGLAPAGMDEATAALFPEGFEESAQGLLPKGWRFAPVGDVVDGIYDGPHATPPESEEGPVFLGIKNLTGTGLDFGEVRHIAESDFGQWTRRVLPAAGDIVFSYEATLGFFALVPPGLRCCLGRRLALIRPRPNAADGHFFFHQFIAAPFQRLLERHTIQGATVNRIALKHFPSYPVMDPPPAVKAAFDATVAPIWARIHANQAQAQSLTQIRDALLPRLISGQLRLPEAAAEAATA
ncbi:MAG: restriction endonuclease subunit S [Piscinibacter sp.]|nr:restriction endonuclease subunit S [Piscinibacter sp.]MBP6028081.1 restriction endonuclease subunit S [Piscinibacter sp.]